MRTQYYGVWTTCGAEVDTRLVECPYKGKKDETPKLLCSGVTKREQEKW